MQRGNAGSRKTLGRVPAGKSSSRAIEVERLKRRTKPQASIATGKYQRQQSIEHLSA